MRADRRVDRSTRPTLLLQLLRNGGNCQSWQAALQSGTVLIRCHMDDEERKFEIGDLSEYQERLQRVDLLRDMINWCIENPVKGKH